MEDSKLYSRLEGMLRSNDKSIRELGRRMCHELRINYHVVLKKDRDFVTHATILRGMFYLKSRWETHMFSLYRIKKSSKRVYLSRPSLGILLTIADDMLVYKIRLKDGCDIFENKRFISKPRQRNKKDRSKAVPCL